MGTEQHLQLCIAGIAAVADSFPGIVSVHDLRTWGVRYMSAPGLRLLRTTLPALRSLGATYYQRYFNPEDARLYLQRLRAIEADDDAPAPLLQRLRASPDQPWTWYLSSVCVLLPDEAGRPLLSLTFASCLEPLAHLHSNVTNLLEEDLFLRHHEALFRQLTPREKHVLRLLVLGHTSGTIARQLAISPNTVTTHRRNINAKLRPETSYDLFRYAHAFNLV